MNRTARTGLLAVAALTLAFVLTLAATRAFAQAPLRIGQATLQLWPEYDDPGVLVIYSGSLTGTTTFPVRVSFPVHEGARNIQATYQDGSGSLLNRDFEVKDGVLTYELPNPNFHLEYYFDRQPGNTRVIRNTFRSNYPIDSLAFVVQQPARSSNVSLVPEGFSGPQTREDGLSYYSLVRQNVAADQSIEVGINYTKSDSGLSSPQLTVTDSGQALPEAGATGAAAGVRTWLPIALITLGAAALAGLLAYFFISQRRAAAPVAPQKRNAGAAGPYPAQRPSATPNKTATGDRPIFCTQCGKPLRGDDRFCSHCGAPRRAA